MNDIEFFPPDILANSTMRAELLKVFRTRTNFYDFLPGLLVAYMNLRRKKKHSFFAGKKILQMSNGGFRWRGWQVLHKYGHNVGTRTVFDFFTWHYFLLFELRYRVMNALFVFWKTWCERAPVFCIIFSYSRNIVFMWDRVQFDYYL